MSTAGPGETAERRSLLGEVAAALRWGRSIWRRIRAWRRFSFTAGGVAFTLGTVAIGLAAMNTGNNLLYLLLGAMLGFIVASSWLSEQAIRDVHVERHHAHPVTVDQDFRLTYDVENLKRVLPSLAVEICEEGLPERAFVGHVPPRGTVTARSVNSFVRRGTYPLGTVTLSTSFPFGLFRKERDIELPGEIVVWPRTDRRVRPPVSGGGRLPRTGVSPRGLAGSRGEYRSLRGYRPGDDPKDIHWRSSARQREPVIREYELDGAETRWICLDTRGEEGDAAEVAIEVAAALAAGAVAERRPFALCAGAARLDAGEGLAHLERALDVLARVDFGSTEPAPRPPVAFQQCILVSVHGSSEPYADVFSVAQDARLDAPVAA